MLLIYQILLSTFQVGTTPAEVPESNGDPSIIVHYGRVRFPLDPEDPRAVSNKSSQTRFVWELFVKGRFQKKFADEARLGTARLGTFRN